MQARELWGQQAWEHRPGAKIVSQAGLQRRRAVMEGYSQQPGRLSQLFWVDPLADIIAASAVGSSGVTVTVNILLLSDGVPYVAITRQRGPVVKVDASIAKITSKTMVIIELWSLLQALVMHPGGKEHAR